LTELLQEKVRRRAKTDFTYFVNEIFSQSYGVLKDGKWTGGDYVNEISAWLGDKKTTIRVSARDHFKSMSFYAHIMWKLLRYEDKDHEIQYFSFNNKMAAYHTQKIKLAIDSNPFFNKIIDKKRTADSIISYSWDGTHKFKVTPRGLLEFKRGIHCPDIYVDDPMQDPSNKLAPVVIIKINDIIKTQIMDMWQNELHIAGTPQTNHDFYFDPAFIKRFSVKILPAIIDEKKKTVLWPEWMSFDDLMMKREERGPRIFNQEYMCSPVYSEEAFVSADRYDRCVNNDAKNYKFAEWIKVKEERAIAVEEEKDVIGGFDIGKKAHPSHLVILEYDIQKKKYVQIHSKWMDGWDYIDQLDYLKEACDTFDMYALYYDNTRAEFEAFDEAGDLPGAMEPVIFSMKSKHSMATRLDKALSNEQIVFLPETRQRNQILIVNNDLQAPETPEGHGDSFFSMCMALMDYGGGGISATVL